MSSREPEYHLPHPGQMIALGCLAFSALVFLLGQMRTGALEKGMLRSQLAAYARKGEELENTLQEAQRAVESREKQIKKAEADESRYAALLDDLMELSREDPEARLITLKWRMQSRNSSPQGASSEAPENEPPVAELKTAPLGSRSGLTPKAPPLRKNPQSAPTPQSLLSQPLMPR